MKYIYVIFLQAVIDADCHQRIKCSYIDEDKAIAEAKFIEVENNGKVYATVKKVELRT